MELIQQLTTPEQNTIKYSRTKKNQTGEYNNDNNNKRS